MRDKALALVALLVAVSTGTGQITGPTEVTVAKGTKNVSVEVSVTADSAEYLALGNLEMIREYTRSSTKLVIRVLTNDVGNGYVVVAAVKNGEMLPLYRCLVRVVEPGPGPAPPVPPEPKPPEPRPPEPKPPEPIPVDPLVKALQTAADADGMPRSDLAKVAVAASNASAIVTKGQTAQRAHDLIKNALSKSPPLGTAVFEIVNGMTGKVFADLLKVPTEIVDDAKAEAIRAPFVKLAKALEEAAR